MLNVDVTLSPNSYLKVCVLTLEYLILFNLLRKFCEVIIILILEKLNPFNCI
jgi:hypothetical protein